MEDHSSGAWAIQPALLASTNVKSCLRPGRLSEDTQRSWISILSKDYLSKKGTRKLQAAGSFSQWWQDTANSSKAVHRERSGWVPKTTPFITHTNRCAAVVQGSLSKSCLSTGTLGAKRGAGSLLADAPQPQTGGPPARQTHRFK